MQQRLLVYLDQNFVSHMREGQAEYDHAWEFVRRCALPSVEVIYVVTDVHVREARNSGRPDEFLAVWRRLEAGWQSRGGAVDSWKLEFDDARLEALFIGAEDLLDDVSEAMFAWRTAYHYMLGMQPADRALEVAREIVARNARALLPLLGELPCHLEAELMAHFGDEAAQALTQTLEANRAEFDAELPQLPWLQAGANLRAEDDPLEVAPPQVIEWVFQRLSPVVRKALEDMFPRDFAITGGGEDPIPLLETLAEVAFALGVVSQRKVRTKRVDRRLRAWNAQGRDHRHISAAAGCSLFVSADKDACRLLSAVHSWAGLKTVVWSVMLPGKS